MRFNIYIFNNFQRLKFANIFLKYMVADFKISERVSHFQSKISIRFWIFRWNMCNNSIKFVVSIVLSLHGIFNFSLLKSTPILWIEVNISIRNSVLSKLPKAMASDIVWKYHYSIIFVNILGKTFGVWPLALNFCNISLNWGYLLSEHEF